MAVFSEFGDMFFRGAAPILEGLGGPILVLLRGGGALSLEPT